MDQSEAGSNGYEEVLHTLQTSKTRASLSDEFEFEFCLIAYQPLWVI